ncbi:carboxymuconolactone decarboxylase family protein [Sphingomonas sp. 28-62-11]|uniref:carboxymuconolactone decarboxylase family protein n=1 Tax=Sphingomonas sp. 28-62-11 TaxID=1970432 RepID=UPI000BD49C06|nr:MAG: carboxymuconolactone decarboxylase [Sphingomonas sp. 28-62-11]
MRLSTARIAPIADHEITPEQEEVLAPFRDAALVGPGIANIFRTLARAPKALKRFNLWGSYILGASNDLSPRDRELIILRTGWLCRSGYEWVQHVRIGLAAGLTPLEIERIKAGPDAPGWQAIDAAKLRATDEQVREHFISDASWAALASFTDKQKMDLVFTIAQYTQVAMILNCLGVQLDAGQTLDSDFPTG